MEWNIGCSGFYYKHWRETFYPAKLAMSKWFDYYTRHFNTLELNVTFYRFPQLPFLVNWYNKSPAHFRFAVKAPRAITHFKKFTACADLLQSFYATINDGLQEKLGPVLFQTPPNYNFTEAKLEKIINALDPAFNNVLEPRHVSWWQPEVISILGQHQISFCGMSHPSLPDEVVQNTPLVYYRFHGHEQLYRSGYERAHLEKIANQISRNKHTKQAWLYFNNDVDTHAIYNARQMMDIAGVQPPQPNTDLFSK